jgi:glycerol-3-phosphate acyltransferase PlsY
MNYILALVLGYFLGNISASFIVGKLTKNIDIRKFGSGNAGATNTLRVLGLKAGLLVFFVDILKGVAAVLIGRLVAGDAGGMIAGAASVAGHIWPVFLGFKGGKGVATSFGILVVMFPVISLILFVVSASLVTITRFMSLGSITAAALLPILLLFFGYDWQFIIFGLALASLVVYLHKGNITRLLAGKENKLGSKPRVK